MTEEQQFNVKEKTPPRTGLFREAMAAVVNALYGQKVEGNSVTNNRSKHRRPGNPMKRTSRTKRPPHRVLKKR